MASTNPTDIVELINARYPDERPESLDTALAKFLEIVPANPRLVWVGTKIGGGPSVVDLDVVVLDADFIYELSYEEATDGVHVFVGSVSEVRQVAINIRPSEIEVTCHSHGNPVWGWASSDPNQRDGLYNLGLTLLQLVKVCDTCLCLRTNARTGVHFENEWFRSRKAIEQLRNDRHRSDSNAFVWRVTWINMIVGTALALLVTIAGGFAVAYLVEAWV